MIYRIIFTILIVFSAIVESTIFPFPLIVLFSVLLFLFFEELSTFLIVFLASVLVDAFLLHRIGFTAIFLFTSFSVLAILEKVFTLRLSAWIIAGTAFFAVEVYRQYAHYPFFLGVEIVFTFSLLLFVIIERRIYRREIEN